MADPTSERNRPGAVSRLLLGLDEAGRGSWVGPLVVGGFLLPASSAGSLSDLGVRDSKQLSAARREEVYRRLGQAGRRLWVSLSPAVIDRSVRVGGLNDLEARAFARLVRRSGARAAVADACDPVAPRFGRTIERLAGVPCRVESIHRADETVPVVAAASIVAKVQRDRALERLRAVEGEALGSGYPSDRRTVAFVRAMLGRGGPAPRWLRTSWRTMERVNPRPRAPTLESFAP